MLKSSRRYDIDWLRVIAIFLLLIYHVAIAFQPWGAMIGFLTSSESWESLWIPMTMLNVWRIPILFFVSGMGVYFAIQSRNLIALLQERSLRILLPFIFGFFAIVPLHMFILQSSWGIELSYSPGQGHLWFLANIFVYVLVLSPVFIFLNTNRNGKILIWIKKIFSHPLSLILVFLVFILEALLLKPNPYELYAMTWHGFFLGLIAFCFGFIFALTGENFWQILLRWRWAFLSLALSLFLIRLTVFNTIAPVYLVVAESNLWIYSVFAFTYKYLNTPSKTLNYLSQAVYPVYILHMIFLYLGCYYIFTLDLNVKIQFFLVLVITVFGSFGFYELISRVRILRLLFGLKKLKLE